MSANWDYVWLLSNLLQNGMRIPARNHATLRGRNWSKTFHQFPLVTLRKTAWKKALREMQWFMSGDIKCPPELHDWWAGQLWDTPTGQYYFGGYPTQFRGANANDVYDGLDQIQHVLQELKTNPHSRRTILTAWAAADMAAIAEQNGNSHTPACCHATVVQFFVEEGELHMTHYQRSADVLLGLPHNLVQYWALLTYFAHHAGLAVGSMHYVVGDGHLYAEASHLQTAQAIVNCPVDDIGTHSIADLRLVYNYSGQVDEAGVPVFLASDFSIEGSVPAPLVTIKPRLL